MSTLPWVQKCENQCRFHLAWWLGQKTVNFLSVSVCRLREREDTKCFHIMVLNFVSRTSLFFTFTWPVLSWLFWSFHISLVSSSQLFMLASYPLTHYSAGYSCFESVSSCCAGFWATCWSVVFSMFVVVSSAWDEYCWLLIMFWISSISWFLPCELISGS